MAKKTYNLDFINIDDLIKVNKFKIDNDNINQCTLYISKIKKYKNELIENVNINENRNIIITNLNINDNSHNENNNYIIN